jgi:hypothetical protein
MLPLAKITQTEADTLEVMLDSAVHSMARELTAWPWLDMDDPDFKTSFRAVFLDMWEVFFSIPVESDAPPLCSPPF